MNIRMETLLLLPLMALTGCTGLCNNCQTSSCSASRHVSTYADKTEVMKVATPAKPELHAPFRVAVYLTPAANANWKWEAKDKAIFDAWAKTLIDEGIAADVFFLPKMLTGKGEMDELRKAAVNTGADALFVVRGSAEVERNTEPLPVATGMGAGAFVLGGGNQEATFTTEGCLFDPSSNHVFAVVQTEGEAKIRPAFLVEEKDGKCVFAHARTDGDAKNSAPSIAAEQDAIDRAKTQAIENLRGELLARIHRMAHAERTPPTAYLPTLHPREVRTEQHVSDGHGFERKIP